MNYAGKDTSIAKSSSSISIDFPCWIISPCFRCVYIAASSCRFLRIEHSQLPLRKYRIRKCWMAPASRYFDFYLPYGQPDSKWIHRRDIERFPYDITPGTVLYLSLYVNNQLTASQRYDLSGSYKTPATVVTMMANGEANFSNSMLGFTVSESSISQTFSPGTVLTVVTWSSNPIWAQVDGAATARSFQTQGVMSYSPGRTIVQNAGTNAPYPLSVGLESAA